MERSPSILLHPSPLPDPKQSGSALKERERVSVYSIGLGTLRLFQVAVAG
jgi:hypothetical protein